MTTPKPAFEGQYGKVWSNDLTEVQQDAYPDETALIGCWTIHAPQSHPVWPWYRLTLVHLRSIKGMSDPIIYLKGATHEFILSALDPNHYPPPLDDVPRKYLTPHNFGAQLICASDDAAIKTLEELALKPIVNGTLNPDTDFRKVWESIFGDNMRKKGR